MLSKIFRDRGLRYWLPTFMVNMVVDFFRSNKNNKSTKHIMFLICDHYEPRHGTTKPGQDVERVQAWSEGYSRFYNKCMKSFGHAPKHTWFYPPHHGLEHLDELTKMVFEGHGELELHYHHENDTSETFTNDMVKVLDDYNKRGLLLSSEVKPKCSFSFIHGDWALDNSCHGKFCGVNDELDILADLGCWGDFTMPSSNECQTRKINSIYYAVDNPDKPKSHDWGIDAAVGKPQQDGFFLMQGPLGINFKTPRGPKVENACLTSKNWGRPDRIRFWIKCNIHIKGKPEWIFIKLHTHGAIEKDFDSLFGEKAYQMHDYLNTHYNDQEKFKLHYVTAREAYNICKAAEQGHNGDPDNYRDTTLPPYVTSIYYANNLHKTISCTTETLHLKFLNSELSSIICIKNMFIENIEGVISEIYIDNLEKQIKISCKNKLILSALSPCLFEISEEDISYQVSGNKTVFENINNEITLKLIENSH